MGFKTDPWGTPSAKGFEFDTVFFIILLHIETDLSDTFLSFFPCYLPVLFHKLYIFLWVFDGQQYQKLLKDQ